MSPLPPLERTDVVGILAALGGRTAEAVDEALGSLELTWLVTELEQRYAVVLELSDADLARISTVTDAVEVLNGLLVATGSIDATGPIDAGSVGGKSVGAESVGTGSVGAGSADPRTAEAGR